MPLMSYIFWFPRILVVFAISLLSVRTNLDAKAQELVVTIYFVNITGHQIDEKFWACGESSVAGPFMSGGTAIDWRNEFADGADVYSQESSDPGVCLPPPAWYYEHGEWKPE